MGKVIIVLLSGMSEPQKVKSGLMFASIAATMGFETIVYCVQDGVEVMVKGKAEQEVVEEGMPTVKQRLDEVLKHGVRIMVCENAVRNKGLSQEDFIEGVEISGAATLIDIAVESNTVLTF
jgi:predicted peroxiredoxin